MPFDHGLPQEVLLESLPPGQAHPAPQRLVVEQPVDLAREINRVAGLAQETGDTISDGVRQPADAAGDDGDAAGHGLDGCAAE